MTNTLTMIELAGGINYFEDTFKIRAEQRAGDLASTKRRGERWPLRCLEALIEASAAEFLVWLAVQSPAKRDRVLAALAPKLEELAALRQRNYQLALKLQREQRKGNGNGHACQ